MNINETHTAARDILVAVSTIENSPALKLEAQRNPQGVMDRLGLSGVARHAVAFAIAAAIVVPSARGVPGVWQ